MDLRYRAAIGEVLAALCMSGLAGEAKAAGARRLNEQRRRVLEACRRGSSDPDALEAEEAAFGWLCDDLLAEGEAHDSE